MKSFFKSEKLHSEAEILKQLKGKQKLQHLWNYYKFHFVCLFILLYIIGYFVYGHLTQKENILYMAFINVETSESLTEQLSTDFMKDQNLDQKKKEFYLYQNLYLTEDENSEHHEYTYASRMKILGSIDNQQLDLVLMNKEAYDAFSQNDYLCDLENVLSSENPQLYSELLPYLQTNTVILEDNAIESNLDASIPYEAETTTCTNGIDLSELPIIKSSGFTEPVYLGVIENSPRKNMALSYIKYLTY